MKRLMFILLLLSIPGVARAHLAPAQLRCEHLENPLGIDVVNPRLGWIVQSVQRGQRQTAYQIVVGSSGDALNSAPDLWDSGKIKGDQTIDIAYQGKALSSRARCWWKVRVWDEDDQPSEWSALASWSMGLLNKSDWAAMWITDANSAKYPMPGRAKNGVYYLAVSGEGTTRNSYRSEPAAAGPTSAITFDDGQPASMLRKSFPVDGGIQRATMYVTARGLYELHINGQRVGKQVFAPGWTEYDTRLLYQTYDVTSMLKTGGNTVGAVLGVGRYAGELGPIRKLGRRLYGADAVTEGRTPAAKSEGVRFICADHGVAKFQVESGTYQFASMISKDQSNP